MKKLTNATPVRRVTVKQVLEGRLFADKNTVLRCKYHNVIFEENDTVIQKWDEHNESYHNYCPLKVQGFFGERECGRTIWTETLSSLQKNYTLKDVS